jgi:CheY-like chemotaxis protein
MMHGRLWVESEPGQGSTFHFSVRFLLRRESNNRPAPHQSLCPEQQPPSDRSGGLKVLVAEDNPVNRKLAVCLLEKNGHTAVVAESGRRVLELLETAEFDIILMDVQMPEMDGFEATAEIRRREQASGKHIPIVAMTAHAMVGHKEQCLMSGMDGYVSKPLRKEEFFAALAAAQQGTTQSVTV